MFKFLEGKKQIQVNENRNFKMSFKIRLSRVLYDIFSTKLQQFKVDNFSFKLIAKLIPRKQFIFARIVMIIKS